MSKNKIIIRSYSKILFSYPILAISILGWVLQALFHIPMLWLEVLWSVVFFATMFIIAFDFDPTKFIILLLLSIITGAAFWVFVLPQLQILFEAVTVSLGFTSHFYIMMTGIFAFLLLIALLSPLFNYFVIERNELYHRMGIFTRAERYAVSNVSFDKEIPDIFEFFMLRAGRITFYPEGGRRLIQMDTVLRVNKKEEHLNKILSRILVDDEGD